METDTTDRRTKSYILMRSIMDYGMGAIYLAVGLFMFFPEKIGVELAFDPTFRYIFGGIVIIYGIWRIYRAIRKEYF